MVPAAKVGQEPYIPRETERNHLVPSLLSANVECQVIALHGESCFDHAWLRLLTERGTTSSNLVHVNALLSWNAAQLE